MTPPAISDAELDAAVVRVLADADTSLDDLKRSHERGRFDTEKQRRAWFLISSLGRA